MTRSAIRIRRISALVVILLCLVVASTTVAFATPADSEAPGNSGWAHDKKDEKAAGKDDGSAETTAAVEAPDEATTVALENNTTLASTAPSGTSGGSTTGNGKSNGKGSGKHAYDPDPPPVQSPPATKGPTACPGYSQEQGGPYDHDNCDGTQGLHGNGGNGKCAGCTGKADDKSPGGQYPGDHNNGYECDHNRGVGKGNPAHSKCSTTTPPCVRDCNPCTQNCNPCVNDCNPGCQQNCNPGCQQNCNPGCQQNCNPGCQTDCGPDEPDDVLGNIIHRAVPAVRGASITRGAGVEQSVLPFTGTPSMVPLISLGLLLITVGSLTVVSTARRRRQGASRPI